MLVVLSQLFTYVHILNSLLLHLKVFFSSLAQFVPKQERITAQTARICLQRQEKDLAFIFL